MTPDEPRDAGVLTEFLKHRDPANVPCRGCTACCHHSRIDVTEEEARTLGLDAAHDAEGWHLAAVDGACRHLGPHGCTVYDRRPATCRSYDCRVLSVLGIEHHYNNGQVAPKWTFGTPTERDAVLGVALQIGARRAMAKRPGDVKWAIREAGRRVARNAVLARRLLRRANYSAPELARLIAETSRV